MKKLISLLALIVCISITCKAQNIEKKYDAALADSLGADDYGMKMYSFVILKTGKTQLEAGAKRDSIFRGHMNNIGRLVEENKLIVAGPFGENDNQFRGLFIFTEPDIEETKKLLETDPAVAIGIFDYEIYPWYGSAALGMYIPFSEKISKKDP